MDELHRNALKPGSRLEWYEILHVIGQGGFGITYLARDTHLNIRVAIKEYLPSELAVRDANATVSPLSTTHGDRFLWGRARFLDEARMLAGFDHPNIVRVNAFFEANNTACMVMRYEAGQSLHKILEHYGRLNEDTLQGLLHPLLDGLEVIHARQIIHRDIKPENIFIRTDNRPVLLDFGSARQALGAADATLTMLVSPGYAAIEQYSRDSDTQGPWTDIYGLAATLYRAISGKSPADAMQRSIALHHDEPDPLTPLVQQVDGEYSAEFLAAIDQALAFKPAQRPQNVNAWRAAFGARPTQAAPPILLPDDEAVTQQPDASADAMPGTGDRAAGTFANSTPPIAPSRRLSVWQRLYSNQPRLVYAGLVMIAIMAAGAVWYFMPTANETRRLPMLADPLLSGERGPIMVVVPAGRYLMGAPAAEPDREADEGPQLMVEIPQALAVSRTEVTVGQFRQFVNHANYVTDVEQTGGCHHRTDVWIQYSSLNWRNPGFTQDDDHPVVCISRNDANAYAEWLGAQTGRDYRLPTEIEWEYFSRAGSTASRHWGNDPAAACTYANVADQRTASLIPNMSAHPCQEDAIFTAAVRTHQPNAFGIYDTLGNVWEYTSDCWTERLDSTDCKGPAVRGGSWSSPPRYLRSANRTEDTRGNRSDFGFRLVADVAQGELSEE